MSLQGYEGPDHIQHVMMNILLGQCCRTDVAQVEECNFPTHTLCHTGDISKLFSEKILVTLFHISGASGFQDSVVLVDHLSEYTQSDTVVVRCTNLLIILDLANCEWQMT